MNNSAYRILMKRKKEIIGYGLLLFVLTMVLLFILSMITNTDSPTGLWWVSVVMAVVLGVIARWFSHRLHPATRRQALTYGVVWAIMLAGILLIIAIPNGTTKIVFGEWSTYLIFIGVAVGPMLVKVRGKSKNEQL